MNTRRRRTENSGLNLDSLMDTLTNVVGILIIILILVQIGVSRAVKKIVSDLPPVSVEQHAVLVAQAGAAAQLVADFKNAADDEQRNRAQLAAANAEFAKIESQRLTDVKLVNLDSIRAQLDAKRKQVEAEKAAMAKLLAEQDRLKALLDTTPKPAAVAPQAAKIVRIPNSRPVPEKARFARVLVAGGRVYPIEVDAAEQFVMREFNAVKHTMVAERKKDAAGKSVIIYDQEKLVQHFAKRPLATRNMSITVPYNKPWTRVAMKLSPLPGKGEPIEVAAALNSQFANVLRSARGGATVVWFHVARDSFETYLRARDITDAAGIPAGWEVAWEPAYAQALDEIPVTNLEPPPMPKEGDPLPIKPPKRALD